MAPKGKKKGNKKKNTNNQDNGGEDSIPPTPIEGEAAVPEPQALPETPIDGDASPNNELVNGAIDEGAVPDTSADAENAIADDKSADGAAVEPEPAADSADIPDTAEPAHEGHETVPEAAEAAGEGEGERDQVDPMQFQEQEQPQEPEIQPQEQEHERKQEQEQEQEQEHEQENEHAPNGTQEETEEAPQLASQDVVPDSAAADHPADDTPAEAAQHEGPSEAEVPPQETQPNEHAEAPAEAEESAATEPPSASAAAILPKVAAPTLQSLLSKETSFSAFRYLSLHSHDFTSRPHHDVDSSHDLESRNMASSFNNWYNKLYTLADSLEFSKGWPVVEAFDVFADALEAPFQQISLWPPEEFFARKLREESPEELDPDDLKYESFWEWKSKIGLSAFCANFAAREVMGRSIFAVEPEKIKRLGSAMFVFAKDLDDEVTATRFRQMTIKLLFESTAYKKSVQKELLRISKELGNVFAPISALLPPPSAESSDKAPEDPVAALNAMILATVGTPSAVLHNTIQKDPVYFAMYHPTPGQNFDDDLMEEVTFNGMGQGRGDVGCICRPGLIRMGFPKYGESPDIGIVLKARVLREAAIEWEP